MMVFKINLPCSSYEECLKIAEGIVKAKGVNASLIKYVVKGSSLEIQVFGSGVEASQVKKAVVNTYKSLKKLTAEEIKTSISITEIMKRVGKPLITDALVEVLNMEGYNAYIREGKIYSRINPDMLLSIAEALALKLKDLVSIYPRASHSVKAFITSYAYLKDLSVKEAVEELLGKGCLIKNDNILQVPGEWRGMLRKCLEL